MREMIVGDVFAGAGSFVRTQAIEGLEILEESGLVFGGVIAQGGVGFTDAPDDFVLHVGDVHDVADLEALELQAAPHQIGENEGAEVADVGEVMHGRAAAIEADGFAGRIARDEFLDRAGEGIEKFQGHAGAVPGFGAKAPRFLDFTFRLIIGK